MTELRSWSDVAGEGTLLPAERAHRPKVSIGAVYPLAMAITLCTFLPLCVFAWYYIRSPETEWVVILLDLPFGLVASGAQVVAFADECTGRTPRLGRCFGVLLRRLPAVLGTTFLSWVALLLGSLLIIPGAIFGVRSSFAICACVVERCSPGAAISRSWKLTQGRGWRLFLYSMAIVAFSMAWGMLAGLLHPEGAPGSGTASGYLLSVIPAVLAAPVLQGAIVSQYFLARSAEDKDYGADTLRKEMERITTLLPPAVGIDL